MSNDRRDLSHAIIHTSAASAAATAGSMAQGAIVGADTPILTSIHVAMVISLGELFGKSLLKQAALTVLGIYAGRTLGVQGAKALLGLFPGIGNAANAAVTFAHTEALGWFCYEYFQNSES